MAKIDLKLDTQIGSVVPKGTSGSVLFIDANGKLAQDNSNFFWDNVNKRLGIGTSSPAETFIAEGESGDYRTGFGIDTDDSVFGPTIYGFSTIDSNERLFFRGSFIAKDNQQIYFGSGSDFYMRYSESTDSFQLHHRISGTGLIMGNTGKVGIGSNVTTNLKDNLTVTENGFSTGETRVIQIRGDHGSASAKIGYEFMHSFGADNFSRIVTDIGAGGNDPKMYFQTSKGAGLGENNSIIIDKDGNVGIGNDNPIEKFNVQGDGADISLSQADGKYSVLLASTASGQGIIGVYDNSASSDTANMKVKLDARAGVASWVNNGGNFGIGTDTPTATLHIKAGTATAGTAPLKFTAGTVLTTPEVGTIEYTTNLFHIRGGDAINIGGDANYTNIGITGDITMNGTADTIDTVDHDLKIDCGTEKTLELVETVYDDLYIGFTGAKVPAANAPTFALFDTSLKAYQFGVNDFLYINSSEMMHGYKEGTDVEIHIHWVSSGTDVDDRTVKWEVIYDWSDIGEAFTGEVIATAETIIPTATNVDKTHYYTSIVTVSGASFKIGAVGLARVRRVASTGTEPSNDPFGLQLGIHYQVNTLGSRQIGTK